MEKIISIFMILFICFAFIGCGNSKVINGIEYDTYGLFNEGDMKNEDIKYRIIVGNVVWSIILIETLLAPIYFVGFSLYEPRRAKTENEKNTKGVR